MLIKRKVQIGAIIVVIALVSNFFYTTLSLRQQTQAVEDLQANAAHIDTQDGDIALFDQSAIDAKMNVIQVQQYLSDVSATRGQNGMDDGFKLAADAAAQFRKDIEQMNKLAAKFEDNQDLMKLLSITSDAFDKYFDLGNKMAHAYVDGGPEQGNQLMSGFDGTSAAIQGFVQKLVEYSGDRRAEIDVKGDKLLEGIIEKNLDIQKISTILGVAIVLLIMIAVAYIIYRVVKPLDVFSNHLDKMASGDLNITVHGEQNKDEVGKLARAFNELRASLKRGRDLEAEQGVLKLQAEKDKKVAMTQLADDFDQRTSGIIKSLAAAAAGMQTTAAQMTAASSKTAHASQIVASAAAEADSNVQTVAAATEELSASSSEIARQISSVAEKSARASGEAQRTSEQVTELNVLADSIGDVIGAIKDIAEQTNLLALNATIEAARAGEAGKGFAVVADEVKKLATETANKTVQIDERVGKIQSAIRATVEAVGRIINDVQDIDHSTSTVASAVEEQNAATSEIGRNVSEASTGTQQVAENITDVQRSAEETGESATNLTSAANELAEIAENLQEQVTAFLSEIRTS